MSVPETMRAVRYHEYGDSSVLQIETIPVPTPKSGHVLVQVAFSGVNPIDWKLRTGLYKDFMPVKFPGRSGREFSGRIVALGSEAGGFSVGQKVFGLANGSAADYVSVKISDIAPVPQNLSLEAAAAVPLGALTAWHALDDAGDIFGKRVLVLGASGGVGRFAVQFARLRGAQVLGTASAASLDEVRGLGAEAVDYGLGPLTGRIDPVDVVLDTVGGPALEEVYGVARPGGLLLTVAGAPSEEAASRRGIRATTTGNKGGGPLAQIAALLAEKKITPNPGPIFPLDQIGQAEDLCQERHARGRILVRVGE